MEQERDRALSNYQAQARYLDETRIVYKHGSQAAYCIAKAVIPLEDESNSLFISVLAGIFGAILSICSILFLSWWANEGEI